MTGEARLRSEFEATGRFLTPGEMFPLMRDLNGGEGAELKQVHGRRLGVGTSFAIIFPAPPGWIWT